VLELAVAFRKDSTSICSETGEEKLVCQAHINNADEEEHHGDMRDPVTSQTEASFQARIKKLEDENRTLVVSKSVIKASKQPDQTEIRRLQRKINFHEELHTTNSQHYDAEIKRLEEKNETLAKVKDDEISVLRKEYGDLSGTHDALLKRATTEWDSQAACISELQQEKSTLSKKISELTTNAELHDVNISWLENDMKKEKDELKEQVRDLQEELKKAKETIAASKASPSPALFPRQLPRPRLDDPPLPSPSRQVRSGWAAIPRHP
jgi:chromosome segregation ATPase